MNCGVCQAVAIHNTFRNILWAIRIAEIGITLLNTFTQTVTLEIRRNSAAVFSSKLS